MSSVFSPLGAARPDTDDRRKATSVISSDDALFIFILESVFKDPIKIG